LFILPLIPSFTVIIMRTAGLFVALGAALNFASADILCNPEALHYKPKIITATEKAGYATSIDELCRAGTVNEARSGSTVFAITSTDDTFNTVDCRAQFNSIIDGCVIGKNMGGGSLVVGGLTLDVHMDVSNNEAMERRAPATKAKPAAKKPAAKKPAAGNKPSKTEPSAPKKPVASPSKPTPTPKAGKDTAPPAGKACALQPGKGKKNAKQVVRSLVSRIFGRATRPGSPASSIGSCSDEPMSNLPGWGAETFFGSTTEIGITSKDLVSMAKEAYNQIMAKHPGLTILVAALYVPNKGVYLGTVVHGAGEAKMKTEAPKSAPALWEILGDRVILKKEKSQTLFHAEDAAMWYAYKKGAVPAKSLFPSGTILTTWGKVVGGGQATYIAPCSKESDSNIEENCTKVLKVMRVTPVK
jgi:cell division septation protein DedD